MLLVGAFGLALYAWWSLEGYNLARSILEEKDDQLTKLAEALLEREVLDASQIAAIAEGRPLETAGAKPSSDDRVRGRTARAGDGETVESIEPEKGKTPGVLPEPGNQPA